MQPRQRILSSVFITSFIGPFMASSVNIAIPAMAIQFSLPVETLSWIVTIFLLSSVAIVLPAGKLADSYGRRRVYTLGLGGMFITTIAAALSPTVPVLLLFRTLQGMSTALIFSTGMALLVSCYPAKMRGKAIGLSAAATYLGLSLGPSLGGIITEYLGWPVIFYATAVGTAIAYLLIMPITEEWYGTRGEPIDKIGSPLYAFASALFLFSLSDYMSNPISHWLLPASILLLLIFLKQQYCSPHPLIDLSLFRNTAFGLSNLAAFIHYSATYAITFLLSLYLQLIQHLSAGSAGMILLLQPVVMAILSPSAGALSDKIQPRIIASIGMAITMLGLLALSFITTTTPLYQTAIILIIIGIGFALFASPNNNAIMSSIDTNHYGVAASVLALMRTSGQAISMSIVTMLLSSYLSTATASTYLATLTAAIGHIFRILSAACIIGIAASLARGEKK